jgi:hypothetical protein
MTQVTSMTKTGMIFLENAVGLSTGTVSFGRCSKRQLEVIVDHIAIVQTMRMVRLCVITNANM